MVVIVCVSTSEHSTTSLVGVGSSKQVIFGALAMSFDKLFSVRLLKLVNIGPAKTTELLSSGVKMEAVF